MTDNVPSLNYFVTPVVAIVIGTYFITSSFFGVYEMAVDTLFLCFLEGKKALAPNSKSNSLDTLFEKANQLKIENETRKEYQKNHE